jgi:hypothetical protein
MRLFLLFMLLLSLNVYGRQEDVYHYPDGKPRYIFTYNNDVPVSNTFLSASGDTIYSWNIETKQITEFTFLGEYLMASEYDSLKNERRINEVLRGKGTKNAYLAETPHAMEWKNTHDLFFSLCPQYTRILREGDFTVLVVYKNTVPSGAFKKYYKGKLVTEGHYDNGNRTGAWNYYSYYFYPYRDVTVFDILGKEYSLIYSLLPALIALILLIAGFIMAGQAGHYNGFFYSVLVLAIASLLLRLCIPYNRYNVWIRHTVPALWFMFWHAMIVISTIDLFIIKRTNLRPIVNVICLLFGIGFSIYIILFRHLDF